MDWLGRLVTGIAIFLSSLFGGLVGVSGPPSSVPVSSPVVFQTQRAISPSLPVFTWTPTSTPSYTPLPWADPATLKIATYMVGTTTQYASYYKDKNQVHRVEYPDLLIKGADPTTFTLLGFVPSDGEPDPSDAYAKDRNHVYHNDVIIQGADPATITLVYDDVQGIAGFPGTLVVKDAHAIYGIATTSPIDFDVPSFVSAGGIFFKDKNHVYCNAQSNNPRPNAFTLTIMPGADPITFSVIPNSDYALDKDNVYSSSFSDLNNNECQTIAGADLATFMVVPGSHGHVATDKTHVYLSGKEFPLDPRSLVVLKGDYVKDARTVYYWDSSSIGLALPKGWRPIAGADPTTFIALPSVDGVVTYTKDAHNVYIYGNVLAGADPSTFEITSATFRNQYIDATDKDHSYWNGRIVK